MKQVAISKLKPYDKNPRRHSPEQVKQIAASIEEFGFTNPILIDKKSRIIAGHGRLEAAKLLALDKVPTITLDNLTDTQRKAYVIADNKLALNADWDMGLLVEEMQSLIDMDFDMELTGFSQEELDELLEVPEILTGDEDAIPEAPSIPICEKGDLWTLGNHRLLCGDATCLTDVERLMGGEKVDLAFADPPYGVGYKYNSHNDNVDPDEYKQFCVDLFNVVSQMVGEFIITPGFNNLGLWHKIEDPSHVGIWTKKNAMTHGRITHFRVWEPILFYGEFKKKRGNDLFDFPVSKQTGVGDHTCPKPLGLVQDLIENFSEKKHVVLDPFLGSGTTLIAAEKTNRKCFGLEIDPHYCDVIIKRWQDLTGKKAKHENGNTYSELEAMRDGT